MFHSVSLFSQVPLARGSRALPSILLFLRSKRNLMKYEVLQVSQCQHQCHYCYLSAASSINKTAEAYSKVNGMLFNNLSNYHYLLTKKKTTLVFSVHAVYLTWDPLSSAEATCALPNSLKIASLSWVPKGGQVKKLLRVSTSAGSLVCF